MAESDPVDSTGASQPISDRCYKTLHDRNLRLKSRTDNANDYVTTLEL